MKILIVSDTHSREENLKRVLEREGMPDHMIHLGDSESGELAIRALVTCPLHMVAGNCDFFSSLPKAEVVQIGKYRMLITHGHCYYVSIGSVGSSEVAAEAKASRCNVAMYGHTHRPFVDESDPGLTVLNPGSLSFPRQADRRPSYIVMEIGEDEAASFEIRYL